MTVIDINALPYDGNSYALEGYLYGDAPACLIFVDMPPGDGPRLHQHPYAEIFVVHEGRATFTVGDEELEACGGQILVAPPNVPHKFVNTGDGPLRQLDIHLSARFDTEWLEE